MTDREWVLLRSQGLVDAKLMLHTAFLARLYWWRFLPIVGLFTSWRHEKLLRVGAYLCDKQTTSEWIRRALNAAIQK